MSISSVRRRLLAELKIYRKSDAVSGAVWVSGGESECYCPACAKRNGKSYTFDELQKILQGEFCQGDDFIDEDSRRKGKRLRVCRCVIAPKL